MFHELEKAQSDLKKHRAQLLANLRGGIKDDLLRKIEEGDLVPPIDADAVAADIFAAMNSQPLWDMALEAAQITTSDVKAALVQVCKENRVKIKEGARGVS